MKKAVVFTLGCKVNSCESASLITELTSRGYEVSNKLEFADLYIINTCAVTAEAEKKSRQAVARAKKFNSLAEIIVVGCASQNAPENFYVKQGVTAIGGTHAKEKILEHIGEKGLFFEEPICYYEESLPPKILSTRSYIKVEDGCNSFCSYCIIPYLRGRARSRSIESVKNEIEYLKPFEAVLTGINLTSYSVIENGVKYGLTELIKGLKDVDCRIRLGSLEVNVINEQFLSALKELKDFAPHFHLSLQSGSNKVLKDMNRKYTSSEFFEKTELIRKYFPTVAITTDIIVAYPTETEQDFLDTLALAEKVNFADLHCFIFSPRKGTVAYKLQQIDSKIQKERLNRLLSVKERLKANYLNNYLGKTLEFIPEEFENGYTNGYTANYIRTYVKGKLENKIYNVRLEKPYLDGASGLLEE